MLMTESDITSVRYRSNWTVAGLILVGFACALFAYAAVDRSTLMGLSEQRRAGWLSYLTMFEWGGINWAIVALVLATLFECRKLARQLRDGAALRIADEQIHFHKNIGQAPVSREEVVDLSYESGVARSDLFLQLSSGRSIRIRNVDDHDAQKFVAMMRKQVAQP